MYFPFLVVHFTSTTCDKGAAEPFSTSSAGQHRQTPQALRCLEAVRTPLGALKEITVQVSTLQLHDLSLRVPGAEGTCSTDSSKAEQPRNTRNGRKEK